MVSLVILALAAALAVGVRLPVVSRGTPASFHLGVPVLGGALLIAGPPGLAAAALGFLAGRFALRLLGLRRRHVLAIAHDTLETLALTALLGTLGPVVSPRLSGFVGTLGVLGSLALAAGLLSALLLLVFSHDRRVLRSPAFWQGTFVPGVLLDAIGLLVVWAVAQAGGPLGYGVGLAALAWIGRTLRGMFAAADQASRLQVAEDEARHDTLTALPNRRALEEYAQQITAAGLPCVVAIADADHFKAVNDTYGHDAGDMVLFTIAQRLRGACRTHHEPWSDMVGRWGGEEFVLLLPQLPAEAAPARVEAIRRTVSARPIVHRGTRIPVTVSVGATLCNSTPLDLDAAVARADTALYAAKAGGRDCLRWHPDVFGGFTPVTLHPPAR
jgi:diguanylate cyclase (GGDEF)-like protein